MRTAWLAAACWLCLPACTISAVNESQDPRPSNSCSADSDCDEDVESCNDGMCQPNDGDLEALLIEVTPPSDSEASHLSFVSHLEAVPTSGGELKLPAVRAAKVTGGLKLPTEDTCYPTLPQQPVAQPQAVDFSLPLSATLIPRERLLGLSQQLYVTAGGYHLDGTYRFDIEVPPGEYDVYMVPDRGQTGTCVVPPQLFRGELVTSPATTLDYKASNSSTLELALTWPKGARTLDGWTADIVEPLGGKPISTEVTLGSPVDDGYTTVDYRVPLVYSTVSRRVGALREDVESAQDVVRLRPPEGSAAPTILFDRSALGLLSKTANITGFTRYPDAVTVEGQLASAEDGSPLAGSVSVVSTAIAGVDEGIIATFQRTVQVTQEAKGLFSIDLPPGEYRVHAVPNPGSYGSVAGDDGLSALEAHWEIAPGSGVQAGKLLELSRSSVVSGRSSLEGAEVRIAPTPRSVSPFFTDALGGGDFTPRGRNALIDSGRFAVSVDPGFLDISLRPPEELGFGWFVQPGVEVTGKDYDLGTVPRKMPSVLRGVTNGQFEDRGDVVITRPVAACSVRAYAYLDKDFAYTRDAASAVSVVQVAETRSDEAGAFRLLIPSSLAAPK